MLPDSAFILIAAQTKPKITAITAQPNAFPKKTYLFWLSVKEIRESILFDLITIKFNLPNWQSDGQNGSESLPHSLVTRSWPQPNGCKNNAINTQIAASKTINWDDSILMDEFWKMLSAYLQSLEPIQWWCEYFYRRSIVDKRWQVLVVSLLSLLWNPIP